MIDYFKPTVSNNSRPTSLAEPSPPASALATNPTVQHPSPSALSMQTGQVREAPFYRFEAQLEFTPIGLVPEGLRMALSFEGRVVSGSLAGARVWGSDPLVIRRDGLGVLDVNKVLSFDGANLYEHVRGYCCPPAGMQAPPLESMASPGFAFPDVPFPITGFSTFAASDPRFAFLNQRLARIDGHASFATGRLVIEARLVEPRAISDCSGSSLSSEGPTERSATRLA